MANGGPNTNGSQFFIVFKDSGFPPAYTVFGHLNAAGVKLVQGIAEGGHRRAEQQPAARPRRRHAEEPGRDRVGEVTGRPAAALAVPVLLLACLTRLRQGRDDDPAGPGPHHVDGTLPHGHRSCLRDADSR